VDRDSERAVCQQIADELRAAIDAGELAPGDMLPSCAELAKQYDVHRDTSRAAVRVLAHEGRVIIHARGGTVVAGEDPRGVIYVAGPVRITARMPSDPERRAMGLPPGVPLLVLERPPGEGEDTGPIEQHPAHVTILEVS
jgi:DNA-binding GntR family transcriptional regulator